MKTMFAIAQCGNGWLVRQNDDLSLIWAKDFPETFAFPTIEDAAKHIVRTVMPATLRLPRRDSKGHFKSSKRK